MLVQAIIDGQLEEHQVCLFTAIAAVKPVADDAFLGDRAVMEIGRQAVDPSVGGTEVDIERTYVFVLNPLVEVFGKKRQPEVSFVVLIGTQDDECLGLSHLDTFCPDGPGPATTKESVGLL